jgi:multiple sugar transport system substrate-binding protein
MRTYLKVVGLVILSIMVFTACGPQETVVPTEVVSESTEAEPEPTEAAPEPTEAAPEPTEAEPVPSATVEVWLLPAANFLEAHEVINGRFAQAHPEITVEQVEVPWEQYPAKLAAAFSSGDVPDVIEGVTPWMINYAKAGRLAPVSDSVYTADEIKEAFYSACADATLWQGVYYGLPLNYNLEFTPVAIYNVAMAEEQGFNTDFATLEEYLEALQQATVTDSAGNIIISGDDVYPGQGRYPASRFMTYLVQFGGSYMNEDRSAFTINTDAGRRSLQLMVDLVEKYEVDDPALGGEDSFRREEAAFINIGPWFARILDIDFPDLEYSNTIVPSAGEGDPVFLTLLNWGLFVPADSENQESAWTYIDFFFEEENLLEWNLKAGEIPAHVELSQDPNFTDDPFLGKYVEVLPYGRVLGDVGNMDEFFNILNDMVGRALLEDMSVDDALAEGEERLNTMLANYR